MAQTRDAAPTVDHAADAAERSPDSPVPVTPRWSIADVRLGAPTDSDARRMGLSGVVAGALRTPAQPMDVATRALMETRFGRSFSQVRLHTGPDAGHSAVAAGAGAFTVGDHVVFGPGFYSPHTAGGRVVLAHELAHVVQQQGATTLTPANSASEAEALSAGERMRNPALPIRIRHTTRPGFAALSLAEARSALWSHVPDGVKEYVRPIAQAAANQMDKVIPPNTEIPKPIENLVRHPVDTVTDAVEHPVEAAKSISRTVAAVTPVVAKAAVATAEVVKSKVKQKVHDVALQGLGAAKGVVLEATGIVDTVAWLPYAAHELEVKALGNGATAQQIVAATDSLTSYAALHALAAQGFAAVDPITHQPTGAFALTGATAKAIDGVADKADRALGDGKAEESLGFTNYEQGELAGSIGTQVVLATVGVEEVELLLKGAGALGAAKSIADAISANPDGWETDVNFWAGVIGFGLTIAGFTPNSGAGKKILKIIAAGPALTGLVPVVKQLYKDYTKPGDQNERNAALKSDMAALIKALVGVVMAVVHPGQNRRGETEAGAARGGEKVPSVDTTPSSETASRPLEPPQAQTTPQIKTQTAPEPASIPQTPAAVAAPVLELSPVARTEPAAKPTETAVAKGPDATAQESSAGSDADLHFEPGIGKDRLAQIRAGEKNFAIDRALTFDIDEVLPVGAKDIKPQRAVARALDPYNRQLLDPNTNQRTKGLGIDPRELRANRGELPPISVSEEPHALLTRRFSEVSELKNIFNEAVASVKEPGKLSPTELKAAVNRETRRIITEGKGPDAVAVRKALGEIGFEQVPGRGWALSKGPPPATPVTAANQESSTTASELPQTADNAAIGTPPRDSTTRLQDLLRSMVDNDVDPQERLGYSSKEWDLFKYNAEHDPDRALADLQSRLDRHLVREELGKSIPDPDSGGRVLRVPSNPLDLPEYQESIEAARRAMTGLPAAPAKKTVAGVEGGDPTLSGYTPSDQYPHSAEATERAVVEGRLAGREPEPHEFDRSASAGDSGEVRGSHAEKQAAILSPDTPVGVSRLMCEDCQAWFRAHAIETEVPQFVADPTVTRVFMPDGTVHVEPHPDGISGPRSTQ